MQPPAHGTVITIDNILAPLIPTIFLPLCAIITGATLGSTCTINLVPLNLFAVGLGPLTDVGKYEVYLKNKEF